MWHSLHIVQTIAPALLGREQIWLTRFHPDFGKAGYPSTRFANLIRPITGSTVHLTRPWQPLGVTLAGGFRRLNPEEDSQPQVFSLCLVDYRLLVPVVAVVGGIGLEPTTFAMSTQRSNQLS